MWAEYKKTQSESTVPWVTHSRVLVPHIGCTDMIEEPLLEVKERRMSRESWGRNCDYWPWDTANPCRLLLRELEGMKILISFFSASGLLLVFLRQCPKESIGERSYWCIHTGRPLSFRAGRRVESGFESQAEMFSTWANSGQLTVNPGTLDGTIRK